MAALALAVGMAGCAARSPEQSAGLRGVGTPGVTSYAGGEQAVTLQDLLDRCKAVPPQIGPATGTRDLDAACSQLHRTMHNQPGNTAPVGG